MLDMSSLRIHCKLLACVRLFGTVAHQAPLSLEFSRQEDWSGLPFPAPGDLPNPGIESRTPTFQADSLPSEKVGKPLSFISVCFIYCGAVILGS